VHPEDAKRIYNWKWRLQNLPVIQTKDARKVRFGEVINPVQKKIASHFPHWNLFLILKARQMGVSTLFLLWHLLETLFHENITTAILAHKRESLRTLFRIIKIAYESIPERIQLADGTVWEKPRAKYDNVNELQFEGLDSRIYVSLEIRSDRVNRLHGSEVHFIKNAADVLAATFSALVPGGVCSLETTANGMSGEFFDLWQAAIAGENDYLPLFYGYQDHEEYRRPVFNEQKFKACLDQEEKKYLALPGMTLEALSWRRRMLKQPGMKRLFKQEFPATAEEAFLTSGKSPFDREKINDWPIRKPIETKMEGRLKYWVKAVEGKRYLVSVDCASGAGTEILAPDGEPEGGTDYSTVGVWDCETLQLVALFRAKWPYMKLHQVVYKLAREYNNAYIGIEATDHGLTVINNLVEHVRMPEDAVPYPRHLIHTTEQVDHKSKKTVLKWGFYTTVKMKPLIIDKLAELVDEEEIKIYSKVAQNEFMKFIVNEKGQYEAMEGYKDDLVMMSAIAMYLIPNALRAGRMTATKSELGLQMR